MGRAGRTICLYLATVLAAAPLFVAPTSAGAVKAAPTVRGWEPHDPDPTCDGLSRSLLKHVTTMFGLQQSLAKKVKEPPESLKSMFKSWAGEPHVSPMQLRLSKLIDREREMAAELNRMASSVGCPQTDVEAELRRMEAEQPVKGPTLEDVPAGDPMLQHEKRQN